MTKAERIAEAERALFNATLLWNRYWFCRSLGDTYDYACKVSMAVSHLMALRKDMTLAQYDNERRRWDP